MLHICVGKLSGTHPVLPFFDSSDFLDSFFARIFLAEMGLFSTSSRVFMHSAEKENPC